MVKENMSPLMDKLFFIKSKSVDKTMNPDIDGSLVKGLISSSSFLNCNCCEKMPPLTVKPDHYIVRKTIELEPTLENTTILLEISKNFGKICCVNRLAQGLPINHLQERKL